MSFHFSENESLLKTYFSSLICHDPPATACSLSNRKERLKNYYYSVLLKRLGRERGRFCFANTCNSQWLVSFLTCRAPFVATLHKTSLPSQLRLQTCVLGEAAQSTAGFWSKHQLPVQAAQAIGRSTVYPREAEALTPRHFSFSTAAPRRDGLTPLPPGHRRPKAGQLAKASRPGALRAPGSSTLPPAGPTQPADAIP